MKGITKTHLLLLGTVLVSFFYKAYLHLFIVQHWIPCDEIINFITIRNLVQTGQPVNLSYYPHGMHFFVYGIWLITRVDPQTLCMFFNPVIGAVSVIVFYYLTKTFVDSRSALLSSAVFAVNEAFLYRSAHFGSSEPLGILLMLGSFYFFVKKRYILCGTSMFLTYEVHLLPFFFGLAVLGGNILIRRFSKKVMLTFGILCCVVIGLFYTNLFPYQRQLGFISPGSFVGRVSPENLMLFPLIELLTYGIAFSGSILVFVYSMPDFRKGNKFTQIWIVISLLMALVLQLTYNSLTIGPFRMLVYISIGLVLLYSFVKIPFKTFFTVIILIGMFISPFLNGWSLMFRVYDSVTIEEIQAIEWIVEDCSLTKTPLDIVADYPIIEYWDLYIIPEYVLNPEFDFMVFKETINARKDYLEGESSQVNFTYVFLSERMEKQAFYEEWGEIRTYQYRKPILDRWVDDPEWEQIYNKANVKIYRRVNT